MTETSIALSKIFDGWDGYNLSILHAIQPLTQEQLAWRPAPNLRSVGEVASHIAFGRIGWFSRMQAPGSQELKIKAEALGSESAIAGNKDEVARWLEDSWQMVANTLSQWTVQDLLRTIRQEYGGTVYLVSYQWIMWRIMTHDVHHGGEMAVMLGMQGVSLPELGDQGGHITWSPLADEPWYMNE